MTTPPRPSKFKTPSLDSELSNLGIKQYYLQQLPGRAPSDTLIDLQSFDPTPFRSVYPPTDPTSVNLPVAISYQDWRWEPSTAAWVACEKYKWFACTLEQLYILNTKVTPAERNFFAVMLNGHPMHTIFDLDGKMDLWAHLKGREVEVIASMTRCYANFFQAIVGRAPDMNHVYWELSCSEKKPISLHMHNVGEAFRSKRDHLEFVLRFRDYLDEQQGNVLVNNNTTLDRNANEKCLVDKVVYTQNRNMRMVYSCKPGGVNLLPQDQRFSVAEALWASLPSYSMPVDDKHYFGFTTYVRTDDSGKECKRSKKTTRARTRSVDTKTKPISQFLQPSHCAEEELSTRRHSPEQIKDIVLQLDVDKRVRGDREQWLRLVWAAKSAWPEKEQSKGLAFMHELAQGCKPSSQRPSKLDALWEDGRANSYNIGTLYNMLKEDVPRSVYKHVQLCHSGVRKLADVVSQAADKETQPVEDDSTDTGRVTMAQMESILMRLDVEKRTVEELALVVTAHVAGLSLLERLESDLRLEVQAEIDRLELANQPRGTVEQVLRWYKEDTTEPVRDTAHGWQFDLAPNTEFIQELCATLDDSHFSLDDTHSQSVWECLRALSLPVRNVMAIYLQHDDSQRMEDAVKRELTSGNKPSAMTREVALFCLRRKLQTTLGFDRHNKWYNAERLLYVDQHEADIVRNQWPGLARMLVQLQGDTIKFKPGGHEAYVYQRNTALWTLISRKDLFDVTYRTLGLVVKQYWKRALRLMETCKRHVQ